MPSMPMIYALVDPISNKMKYVGKSDNPEKRLKGHISEARHNSGTHRISWLRKLARKNLEPILLILEEVSKETWQERERYWISYGLLAGWPLTNGTEGGEGITNPSNELREKRSKAALGNTYGKGKRSKDFCIRMAEAAKETKNALGHKVSKKTRKRISKNLKAYFDNGGERTSGEQNGRSKLCAENVKDIRHLYTQGGKSYAKIAKLFGVSRAAIGLIIRRERWIHI